MTLPATISIVIAVIGALVAIVTARLSAGPGWRELAAFAVCAGLAAAYAGIDAVFTLPVSDAVAANASRVGLCIAGLHGSVWFVYGAAQEARSPNRFERFMVTSGVVVGALALVPGLFVTNAMYSRPVRWLGVVYRDAYPTALGQLCYAYYTAALFILIVRYVLRWHRGVRGSLAHAVGLAALFVAGINDSLAAARVYDAPYLAGAGFLVVVSSVGAFLTSRFVESARSFEEQTAQLRATQAELVRRERLAALGELSAVVAHEVRTPVSIMFNALSVLRRQRSPEETSSAVAIVEEEAQRLKRIIDDLLAFASPHSLRVASVELRPLVTNAVEAARVQLGSSCDVAVDVDEAMTLDCDEHLVREAVVNLVTNALQASRGSEPVRVEASREGDRVRIAVTDDGAGIPEDARARLFTPFFTTRASGTGLGLAIVRRVAEAHGGEAFVDAHAGPGAKFVLVLPVARS